MARVELLATAYSVWQNRPGKCHPRRLYSYHDHLRQCLMLNEVAGFQSGWAAWRSGYAASSYPFILADLSSLSAASARISSSSSASDAGYVSHRRFRSSIKEAGIACRALASLGSAGFWGQRPLAALSQPLAGSGWD